MRVPVYTEQTIEQAGRAGTIATPDVGAERTAAEYGKAVASIQKGATDIYEREKKKAQTTEVNNAVTRGTRETSMLLYGDAQSENDADKRGFLSYENKDAASNEKTYSEKWQTRRQRILDDIKDPETRSMAAQKLDQIGTRYGNQLRGHTFKQLEAHQDNVFTETLEAKREDAAENYSIVDESNEGVPISAVMNNVRESNQIIDDYGKLNGWNSKRIKNAKREQSSKIHKSVIEKIVSEGDDEKAKAYFTMVKDRGNLTTQDQTAMMKLVDNATELGDTQRWTDKIVAKNMPEKDALDYARRKIKDSDVRQGVVRSIKIRKREERDFKDQQGWDAYENLYSDLEKSRGKAVMSPMLWSRLNPAQKRRLQADKEQMLRGKPAEMDWDAWDVALKLAQNEPEQFKKIPISWWKTKFTDTYMNKIVEMRNGVVNNKEEAVKGILSDDARVKDAAVRLGVTNKKDQAAFRSSVDTAVVEWKRNNNKKHIPQKDLQEIIDFQGMKVITEEGFIFDSKERVFKVPDSQFTIKPDLIPENLKQQAMRLLKARGLEETPENFAKVIQQIVNK